MKLYICGSEDSSAVGKILYNDINSLVYDAFGITLGRPGESRRRDFRAWTQNGATRCKFTVWFTTMDIDDESRRHWAYATPVAQNNGDALLEYYGVSGSYDADDASYNNNSLRALVSRFDIDLKDLLEENYPEYSITTTVEGRGNIYGGITVSMVSRRS